MSTEPNRQTSGENAGAPAAGKTWFVSRGEPVTWKGAVDCEPPLSGPATRFSLSPLAYYLVTPRPVRIQRQLIGCEVTCHDTRGHRLRSRLHRLLPGWFRPPAALDQVILSDRISNRLFCGIRNEQLRDHMDRLDRELEAYDGMVQTLNGLDTGRVADIVGLCRDAGGNRSRITLRGGLSEKIDYLLDNLLREVEVILSRPYTTGGLFEMEGLDVRRCNTAGSHSLIHFPVEDGHRAWVLKADGSIDFPLEPASLLADLHLLEQSIITNSDMQKALHQCLAGDARAIKLLINRNRQIDYSRNNLPELYEKVFLRHKPTPEEMTVVKRVLNEQQVSVSFSFIPTREEGPMKVTTAVSVFHEVSALDSIRDRLPHLYREIRGEAALKNAGRFYLLEAMKGVMHAGRSV